MFVEPLYQLKAYTCFRSCQRPLPGLCVRSWWVTLKRWYKILIVSELKDSAPWTYDIHLQLKNQLFHRSILYCEMLISFLSANIKIASSHLEIVSKYYYLQVNCLGPCRSPTGITKWAGVMFRIILRRYGIVIVTIGLTLISILLSLGISWGINAFLQVGPLREPVVIAIIAPLLIAPIMNVQILRLIIQLDEAEQRLQVLSHTDELTQTYNRRYFMQYIDQEFKRVQRYGGHFLLQF